MNNDFKMIAENNGSSSIKLQSGSHSQDGNHELQPGIGEALGEHNPSPVEESTVNNPDQPPTEGMEHDEVVCDVGNAKPERVALKAVKQNVVRCSQKVDDDDECPKDKNDDLENDYDDTSELNFEDRVYRFLNSIELFRDATNGKEAFVSATFQGIYQTFPISSKTFRRYAQLALTSEGKLPPLKNKIDKIIQAAHRAGALPVPFPHGRLAQVRQ